MSKEETGARVDLEFEQWKRDLESMKGAAASLASDERSALVEQVENLRRELQGLRIKKVATWYGPEGGREEASAHFLAMWEDWVERARALKDSLAE